MSKVKSGWVVVGVSLALVLAACAAKPIHNVTESQVSSKNSKSLQASQVRQAIVAAGVGLGWKFVDIKPGMLEGTLRLREHVAVVDIPYSTSTYSIIYKSGVNLGEQGGQIHKNYNGWVQNLDKNIGTELARL